MRGPSVGSVCGRFVASRPIEDIVDQFAVDDVRLEPELVPGPRFNVCPQDEVLAAREVASHEGDGVSRRLGAYRWGLVPSWAKDPSTGQRAFNARAESVREKPMFRSALAKRRCLVPADAFYEWQRLGSGTGARKQPWCFRAADGSMLAFAGLWEVWRPRPDEPWIPSCTIITTEANDLMAPIHDRMPVVLAEDDYEAWLVAGELDEVELERLLSPPPDDVLVCYEVGSEVGNSKAEGPQLVEPLGGTELSETGSDT